MLPSTASSVSLFHAHHMMVWWLSSSNFWDLCLIMRWETRAWKSGAISNSDRCSFSAKSGHVTQGRNHSVGSTDHVTLCTCAKEKPLINCNAFSTETKKICIQAEKQTQIKSTSISELKVFGGPEKGRLDLVVRVGKKLKPWQPSQTSLAEAQPGCWGEHHPGQWWLQRGACSTLRHYG